jgi:predicted amidohydrolase YtcJ
MGTSGVKRAFGGRRIPAVSIDPYLDPGTMHRHTRHLRALLPFIPLLAFTPAAAQQKAVVYLAQRIYTMEADSVYTASPAVAVRGDTIVAVGTSADVEAALRQRHVEYTVDRTFAGQVIFPGFVEAHTHFQMYGTFAAAPYVGYWDRPRPGGGVQRGLKTLDEVIDTLRAELRRHPARGAVFGYGADPIYWGGTRLTAADLNRVSATVPVMVQLASGHIVVCNDAMLALVKAQDPAEWNRLVASGAVVQLNGRPMGELDEVAALTLAFDAFTRRDPAFALYAAGALDRSANLMRRAGITTATDLLFGEGSPAQERAARTLYASAADADPAFPRVYLAYSAAAMVANYPDSAVAHVRHEAQRSTGKIRVGPVKIVYDGSIQGYTAELTQPYVAPPAPGANPIWNVTPAEQGLYNLARPFWGAGIRLAVHVNGDSAAGGLITVLRRMETDSAWADHRTTFEHNQTTRADQYDEIHALGATVNLFPGHIWFYGPQHVQYTLGLDRAANIAAADWALVRGIPFSLHSDAPVTPAAPLFSAWAAVNRVMPTGDTLGKAHRITVGQALRAVTMGSAYLLGAEGEIGSIRPGKKADFAVLGQDPFAVDALRLCAVPVVATVIGGVVWTPPADKPTTPVCPAVPRPNP